jgi:hypothetical protein
MTTSIRAPVPPCPRETITTLNLALRRLLVYYSGCFSPYPTMSARLVDPVEKASSQLAYHKWLEGVSIGARL